MSISKQIILDAGKALRDRVLSISDDIDFDEFRRDAFEAHGLSMGALARVSGIKVEHVIGKHRAGVVASFEKRGIKQIPAYVKQAKPYHGKALTLAEHGDPDRPKDWAAWWLENCPLEYRTALLADHIDGMNLLDAIFLETHGRLPADEGRAYYERQRLAGRSWGAICAEIERHSKGL